MEHCLRKNGFSKQPFNIYAYEYVFKSESEKEPFRTKKNGTQLGHGVQLDTILGIIVLVIVSAKLKSPNQVCIGISTVQILCK